MIVDRYGRYATKCTHDNDRPGLMRHSAGAWFAERYGREPDGTWFAPGRVNLMGGPDYTEGFVLPFALGIGVTATAARRTDRRIALASRQQPSKNVELDIDALEPGSVRGWAAYPAGVAWALRQAGYLAKGADIAIDADLPAGAGLSSSAALECATALALTELHQVPVPRPELAALARRAENDFAGIPSGIMDQIAALLSRAGHALLLDCRSVTGTPVPLDPAAAGLRMLIIDTGARHAVGDGRYAERRQACEQAAAALHVRSLRDVTDAGQLTRLSSDPALHRLAEHVLAEQRRVLRAADLLRAGDQASLGPLLTASHHSLRDRFKFSWPQADEAVEAAVEAGANGARMTGGGFGGCVIALVPATAVAQIRQNVTDRFARRHWPAPHFLAAVPSAAARRVRLTLTPLAGSGGAGWLGAHVVADAGHDVAQVVQVVAGQGVEQQAGDLDVAGQDAVDQGPAVVGDRDQGGAFVVGGGGAGDEAGLFQQAGLVGQAASAVDDAVGQLGHGQRAGGAGEAGQQLELDVADAALGA
jgi:galactokinase